MRNKKYDDILEKLPQVLNDGLKNLKFTAEMRSTVKSRLERVKLELMPRRKKRFSMAIPAAILLFVCLISSFALNYWNNPITKPPMYTGHTFEAQETLDVDLDGREPLEIVNTWKVHEANNSQSLMALIWARDKDGRLNVISTLPFEGTEFLPIEVLTPSMYQGQLVIIATTDGQNRIYYRVIGYDGNQVMPYLERSAMINEMRYQMLREIQRLLPASMR